MIQALFSSEPAADTLGQFFPPKVFAQPFRLVFKGSENGKTAWVEVRSLSGLRTVFEKVESGELVELNRLSSIEMQLWGHMAEHVGFLRIQGNTSTLGAGIQPLGEGIAPLAEDLAILMGGDDVSALQMLDGMRNVLNSRPCNDGPMEQTPLTHEFVKPDGMNLTEQGENALLNLVHGAGNVNVPTPNDKESADSLAFRKKAENAIAIYDTTPIGTPEEVEAEVKESIDCGIRGEGSSCKRNAQPPEGAIKVGPEIAKIGNLIAAVGRGLDNEADKALHEETEAALRIFDAMIRIDAEGLEAVKRKTSDILEQFGTSMDEIKELSERARAASIANPEQPGTQTSKLSQAEAQQNLEKNVQQLMREITEFDLVSMVAQSEPEQTNTEEQIKHEQHAGLDPEHEQIRDKLTAEAWAALKCAPATSHYDKSDVKPASDVPMVRKKWLEEQQKRGPASMDTFRSDEQAESPYYGNIKDLKPDDGEHPSK